MAKIAEVKPGPMNTPEEQRRAMEALIRKINEIIRALNDLLPD